MSPTPEFRLPDPGMERWPWFWDAMHCPRPLPMLAQEAIRVWMNVTMGRDVALVNGYLYMSVGPQGTPAEIDAAPESDPADAWTGTYLPRIREATESIRTANYDPLPAGALAETLPGIVHRSGIAFATTMAPLPAMMERRGRLTAFCQQCFGDDEGELLTGHLLQAQGDETSSIGASMATLGAVAATLPAVAGALHEGRFGDLAQVQGGERFLTALDAFLAEYGHGNETWFEFHHPTWAEEPARAITLIARFLETAGHQHDPAILQARAREQHEAAVVRVQAALQNDDERADFRRLLSDALAAVPIIEERAKWQLRASASLRAPALELGRKLTVQGLLDTPEDVFHLTLDELRAAAWGAMPAPRLRERVRQRRDDFASWERLQPPPFLGAPMPPHLELFSPMLVKFMGIWQPGETNAGEVRGFGASRGTAEGVARVITKLSDADRLLEGDVLVCRSTAPPWTPLFAIAAAVVTDSGGVLSHAAIEAREYAVPCVVGTRDGTQRIPDGARVRVDGTTGIVEVLTAHGGDPERE